MPGGDDGDDGDDCDCDDDNEGPCPLAGRYYDDCGGGLEIEVDD